MAETNKRFISSLKNISEPHLEDTLLNKLSAIDNVADDEDEADDQVGHQGGVAEVLRVDVGVGVAELQRGGGEVEVVAVVSVSKTNHFKLSERKSTTGGGVWPCIAICIIPLKANIIRLRSA